MIAGARRGRILMAHRQPRLPEGASFRRTVCMPPGVLEGRCLDSVVCIGTRPTFGAGERLLEVSILDERLELYGETT